MCVYKTPFRKFGHIWQISSVHMPNTFSVYLNIGEENFGEYSNFPPAKYFPYTVHSLTHSWLSISEV